MNLSPALAGLVGSKKCAPLPELRRALRHPGERLAGVQSGPFPLPRGLRGAGSCFPPRWSCFSWACTGEAAGQESKTHNPAELQGEVQAGKELWIKSFQVPVNPKNSWCSAGEAPALPSSTPLQQEKAMADVPAGASSSIFSNRGGMRTGWCWQSSESRTEHLSCPPSPGTFVTSYPCRGCAI